MTRDFHDRTLSELLAAPPKTVAWTLIEEFDRFDHRVAMANCTHANIVGVNEGYVEWCSNDMPPGTGETLAWIWVIRPDLSDAIIALGNKDYLQDIIEQYLREPWLRW